MITGTLTENATGFALTLHALTFDIAGLQVVPNPYKSSKNENHPDYHIQVRTPRGNMMRCGAMWKAKSERSGTEYFSISVTDRNARTWRMNAVTNQANAAGTWSIVPLAGGQTQNMMLTGSLEATDDGAHYGLIESFDFSMNVTLVPTAAKTKESQPDFNIEAQSPSGKAIRLGAAWRAVSASGNDYLSLSFYTPHGDQVRANAVTNNDTPDGTFSVIPLTNTDTKEESFV